MGSQQNDLKVPQAIVVDGFAVEQSFLPPGYVGDLLTLLEKLPSDERSDRVRRAVVFARRNLLDEEVVQSLLRDFRIASLIESISEDAIPVRAILFDKTGDANWTVPWHQDRSIMVDRRAEVPGFGPWSIKACVVHVQPPVEILRQMFTLRVHLDPCGWDNGPLRIISNTHHRILDAAAIDEAVASNEIVNCTTEAGGIVVMRPLILHSSLPAKMATHRRVIHIEFGPPRLPEPLQWAAQPSSHRAA